jgi:hypothetical protein
MGEIKEYTKNTSRRITPGIINFKRELIFPYEMDGVDYYGEISQRIPLKYFTIRI